MNPKIWIPLSAAVVTGSAAAWAGYQLVSQQPGASTSQQVPLEDVVVAARPIPAGAAIAAQDLQVVRVERGSLIAEASGSTAALIGRIAAEPIARGQPVSMELIAEEGSPSGLAAALPNGFRAITLEINRHSGLEGFLYPESRVDIIAALGTGNETTARAVAQNVRVLAVAGRLQGQKLEQTGEEQASLRNTYNVTLMVTIEQAAAIELACESGSPRLMLRPGTDQDIHPFSGMTMAQLRGEQMADPFTDPADWEPAVPVNTDPEPRQADPVTPPASTTQPADPMPGEQAVKSQPRTHVIEVIRAGVTSRMEMLLRSGPRTARGSERAIVNNDTTPAAQ